MLTREIMGSGIIGKGRIAHKIVQGACVRESSADLIFSSDSVIYFNNHRDPLVPETSGIHTFPRQQRIVQNSEAS